jgi:hypothetical protein
MFDRSGRHMGIAYGIDPYNTTAPVVPFLQAYNGPMTPVAYREQASWDFTPGTQRDKLNYYAQHGMHRLPLRPLPHLEVTAELPAFLRRQAE